MRRIGRAEVSLAAKGVRAGSARADPQPLFSGILLPGILSPERRNRRGFNIGLRRVF